MKFCNHFQNLMHIFSFCAPALFLPFSTLPPPSSRPSFSGSARFCYHFCVFSSTFDIFYPNLIRRLFPSSTFHRLPQKISPKEINFGLDYQENVCYTYYVLYRYNTTIIFCCLLHPPERGCGRQMVIIL